MSLTRLLKAHDICDIGHVDSALQLKTRLSFRAKTRLVFVHHKFGLLFVRVDVLAAQKNALKQEDVVLKPCHVSGIPGSLAQWEPKTPTSLSLSLPLSPLTTAKVPKRSRSPNDSILRDFQSSTRSERSTTAAAKCSLWIASFAASSTF